MPSGVRIIVVEECWAKKYNLPDKLWKQRYEEPKQVRKYYNVRHVFTPDGTLVRSYPSWLSLQYSLAVSNNPRLHSDRYKGRPFFTFKYQPRQREVYAPADATASGGRPEFRRPPGNAN